MTQRQWVKRFNRAVNKVQKLLELKNEARVDIVADEYHYTDKDIEVKYY